jgi:hypothetical protein
MFEKMTFTQSEREALASSVCLVTFESTHEVQTAWLISSSGFLLTAGHGIKSNQLEHNAIVSIVFGEKRTYEAVIVDYKYKKLSSSGSSIDYALLKLTVPPPSTAIPVKLLNSTDLIDNKDLLILGFRSANGKDNESVKTSVKGSVSGRASTSHGHPYLIQLNVENRALHGMSGAPVCIKWGGKVVAVGLQCVQDGNHLPDAFMCPISDIYASSLPFRRLFEDMGWTILDLDPSFFLQSRLRQHCNITREVLFIEKLDNTDSIGCQARDLLYDKWDTKHKVDKNNLAFDMYIQSSIKRFTWVNSKNLKLTVKKVNVYNEDGYGRFSLDKTDTSFFSIFSQAISENLLSKDCSLRIVFDLDDILLQNAFDGFWSNCDDHYPRNGVSHLLLVKLGSHNEIQSHNNILILIINVLPLSNLNLLSDILLNIIEDAMLDICVSNSIKNLFSLYRSVEAKRHFSKAKAQFTNSKNHTPYCLESAGTDMPYVSFASCSRESLDSPIDFEKLHRLWQDFLHEEVNPIGSNSIRKLEPVEYDDIERHVLDLKRFSGQISKRRLKKQFLSVRETYPDLKLFFFAMYMKRPRTRIQRISIASVFSRMRCRMNMFSFFPAHRLDELMLHREYVRLSIFNFFG